MITDEYLALLKTNQIHESFEKMEAEADSVPHYQVWAYFRETHCDYKPHHCRVNWWESVGHDGCVISEHKSLEMAALVSYIDYEKHGFKITALDALGFAIEKVRRGMTNGE